MKLEEAVTLIKEHTQRMSALYGSVIFDEYRDLERLGQQMLHFYLPPGGVGVRRLVRQFYPLDIIWKCYSNPQELPRLYFSFVELVPNRALEEALHGLG